MSQLYRMSDDPTAENRAAVPCTQAEAARWNTPELQMGVFATVNSFNGARRKENLVRINAWAIDMDEGTKAQQVAKLHASPLVPSLIIETKRGYQAYWVAKDGQPEHWNAIVLERLVPHFGADKNARDLCRILRVAGYLHLKDPADPFRVRVGWKHHVAYSEQQMARAFAWVPNPGAQREAKDEAQRAAERTARELARQQAAATGVAFVEKFWDAVYGLDCEEGLLRLCGHAAVRGERFTFKGAPRGHLNIFVDGKGTSCFVDEYKRIGSSKGGGPTLARWLAWYGNDVKTQISVLKELFPELVAIDDAGRKAWRAA